MKKAFTLAEVLITLGLIGVVAAMTLPSLINNKQNKELEAALKKNYTVINQALDMYQSEYGERVTQENCEARKLKDILTKYLSLSSTKVFASYINQYKNYNETSSLNYGLFDDGVFMLNDGSLYFLENGGQRIYITVDVNGYFKRPNRLGYDLFMFQIDKNGKLLPMGTKGTYCYSTTDYYCSNTSTSDLNGAGCTVKALTDKNYFKNLP